MKSLNYLLIAFAFTLLFTACYATNPSQQESEQKVVIDKEMMKRFEECKAEIETHSWNYYVCWFQSQVSSEEELTSLPKNDSKSSTQFEHLTNEEFVDWIVQLKESVREKQLASSTLQTIQ